MDTMEQYEEQAKERAKKDKLVEEIESLLMCTEERDFPLNRMMTAEFIASHISTLAKIVGYIRLEDVEIRQEKISMKKPKVVCLCGSTRFMETFFEVGWDFTLKGYIVLSVGVCKHAEHHGAEALGEDVVRRLDELHLRKIDLADEVFVLNVNGYIGESTGKEIEYAKKTGKPISYLEEK